MYLTHMEIDGRQEGAVEERDIKGEVGDLESEKGTEELRKFISLTENK